MSVRTLLQNNKTLEEWINESYGEITPEIEQLLLDQEKDVKGLVSWAIPKIKELQSIAEAKKEYAKEVAASGKVIENKVENLKALISKVMLENGVDKVEIVEGKASLREYTRVIIENEALLEGSFITEKVTKSINKKAIKEALKVGDVAGATFEINKTLQLKG